MSRYDIALFDLDGTISKSADGIKYCLMKTLDKMEKPHPDLSDYSKYIGPPLFSTFQNLCGLNEEEAQQAVEIYVKLYDIDGLKRNELFEGIDDVLKKLKENGVKLAICSSKHEAIATEVVKLLGVYDYFDKVCGSTIDGSRKEKEELIPYALNKLCAKDSDKVAMIGDTKFDCRGALHCCVDFIGVTYGYGTLKDMKDAGGKMFAHTPQELHKYLL
ncbi:MAG: HAD family hydrolase [Ruminococcaceae bacterium]|nr:HAD family hydrolase [Oscillospiraceae bacterium]